MDYDLVTILGPTATGKTQIAAQLAYEFNAEIILADTVTRWVNWVFLTLFTLRSFA